MLENPAILIDILLTLFHPLLRSHKVRKSERKSQRSLFSTPLILLNPYHWRDANQVLYVSIFNI